MERGKRRLRRKVLYQQKMKKAAHLLLFRQHRKAGMWGWELRRIIGADYLKVIDLLNEYLSKLDLKVNVIPSEESEEARSNLDKARFFVTIKSELTPAEAKMCGWRIDDLAALGIVVAYIISRQGKASRSEVEKILKSKLPEWKVSGNINRYINLGYISEDEHGNLYLDWRAKVEIDQKSLVNLLLSA